MWFQFKKVAEPFSRHLATASPQLDTIGSIMVLIFFCLIYYEIRNQRLLKLVLSKRCVLMVHLLGSPNAYQIVIQNGTVRKGLSFGAYARKRSRICGTHTVTVVHSASHLDQVTWCWHTKRSFPNGTRTPSPVSNTVDGQFESDNLWDA